MTFILRLLTPPLVLVMCIRKNGFSDTIIFSSSAMFIELKIQIQCLATYRKKANSVTGHLPLCDALSNYTGDL